MKTNTFIRSALILVVSLLSLQSLQAQFTLPTLPYAKNALAPVISEQTMELHYGKHLQTYINNLNSLIIDTEYEKMDLVNIVKKSEGALFNNAGQTLNHNLYFAQFSQMPKTQPTGPLAEAINKKWGSFDSFKAEYERAGKTLFASGWVWLAKTADGKLEIVQEANAGNPVTKNMTPLLGIDVWEHAYYLDYQKKRADHITALWKIIDWKVIESRF